MGATITLMVDFVQSGFLWYDCTGVDNVSTAQHVAKTVGIKMERFRFG